MKFEKWTSAITFLMIITVLIAIIVILLFFNDSISIVGNNTESEIYTAISIMVALFAALFIWTAVKESDFRDYKSAFTRLNIRISKLEDEKEESIKELKKNEIEHLQKLSKLNYTLFHVSREGANDKDDFDKFREQLFKVVELNMITDKEIFKISRIIWQRDKIDEAFLIRRQAYENHPCLYNALNYCSLSNYMHDFGDQDLICSDNNLKSFISILTKHTDEGYGQEGCEENKIWKIAGIRYLRAAKNDNKNLQLALYCFIRAIKLLPSEKYYRMYFITAALCLYDFNIDSINIDTIEKLNNLNQPDSEIPLNDLYQYIIYELFNYTELKIENVEIKNVDVNELVFQYFAKWKSNIISNIKSVQLVDLLYQAFFIFIEDFIKLYKNKNGGDPNLYKFFTVEVIAKRTSMKDSDKASLFSTYRLLKNKYANHRNWNYIRLIYLTFYNFLVVDDYEADIELNEKTKLEIYQKVVPNWIANNKKRKNRKT